MTANYFESIGADAQVSVFAPPTGVRELHAIITIEPRGELFAAQLQRIYQAQDALMQTEDFRGATCIMKRYFLSDSTNQEPLMRPEPGVSVSVIQQQPLCGSKVAVWLYCVTDCQVAQEHGAITASRNGYRHIWQMGLTCNQGDSAQQTAAVLTSYEQTLAKFGATLEANCQRTWFFVRDVDTQYAGMVRARRDNFVEQGLTQHTHYIASTGIGGLPADTKALIQLGAYAITGLDRGQVRYIQALTHLNPTYEYGVTFERGTAIEYGDRAHVLISGTASINNQGEVVHVGDIVQQTRRMWENVEKLLEEAGAAFTDVAQMIVYLRDTADYDTVAEMFAERFPDVPKVITLAPVCRPTWLIEMECIAIAPRSNAQFRAF